MELEHADPRLRYGVVLATIVLVSITAGWTISVMSFDSRFILAIPIMALIVAGLAWDRIFLHGEAI